MEDREGPWWYPGGGHQRRHSLALPEAKKGGAGATKANHVWLSIPIPGASGASSNRSVSPAGSDKGASLTIHKAQSNLSVRAGNRGASHGRSQSMAVGTVVALSQGRGQVVSSSLRLWLPTMGRAHKVVSQIFSAEGAKWSRRSSSRILRATGDSRTTCRRNCRSSSRQW
jgi:hypothetical protein